MPRRPAPDRVHVFDVENHDGHAGVRARQGVRGRRRLGQRRQRQLQPPLLDPRQRAVQRACSTTTRDAREPRDPAGAATAPASSPATCGWRSLREHLDLPTDGSRDDDLLDADRFVQTINASAKALDEWHAGGRQGPRPPGRLRPHRAERMPMLTRLWATPLYRMLDDPDGRPLRLRWSGTF